ncbi:MAG TPA: hypothetical protein VNZ53_37250 [Steroidobacteraceae bacterium]|nr:hypothetical protein [Steroidobacteraceae bacterium]
MKFGNSTLADLARWPPQLHRSPTLRIDPQNSTTSVDANLFQPNLLLFSSVEGIDKTDKEMFRRACTRAALPAQRCIFVGESDAERKVAMSAQLRVSYHPLHAFFVLGQLLETLETN